MTLKMSLHICLLFLVALAQSQGHNGRASLSRPHVGRWENVAGASPAKCLPHFFLLSGTPLAKKASLAEGSRKHLISSIHSPISSLEIRDFNFISVYYFRPIAFLTKHNEYICKFFFHYKWLSFNDHFKNPTPKSR